MIGQVAFAAATSLALTACATQAPAPAPAPDAPEASAPAQDPAMSKKCDSTNIQQFVGQARSAELEKKMLDVSGASLVRWAPFGTAVTMEFRADRLTAFLDENNRINRISCS
jgi:hypothetical protein